MPLFGCLISLASGSTSPTSSSLSSSSSSSSSSSTEVSRDIHINSELFFAAVNSRRGSYGCKPFKKNGSLQPHDSTIPFAVTMTPTVEKALQIKGGLHQSVGGSFDTRYDGVAVNIGAGQTGADAAAKTFKHEVAKKNIANCKLTEANVIERPLVTAEPQYQGWRVFFMTMASGKDGVTIPGGGGIIENGKVTRGGNEKPAEGEPAAAPDAAPAATEGAGPERSG